MPAATRSKNKVVQDDLSRWNEEKLEQSWSAFEKCPLEVVQLILNDLEVGDVLALKFASKRISSFARTVKLPDRQQLAPQLARLEAIHFKGRCLPDLTCSSCGQLLRRALGGFEDKNYRRSKVNRKCIRCLHRPHVQPQEIYINRVLHCCCNFCHRAFPKTACCKVQRMNYAHFKRVFGYHGMPWDDDRLICEECVKEGEAKQERKEMAIRAKKQQVETEMVRARVEARARRTTSGLRLPGTLSD